MAKTIKFNLICDDKPVRTIEDLQNNFSIEDVLTYYDNQLLHRWLSVRGYNKELDEVTAITCEKPIEIIKKLIDIFNVDCDGKKVEENIYMLEYLEQRKQIYAIYEKGKNIEQNIIENYLTRYKQLVEGILANRNDAAKIKANIAEIVNNYDWILELNQRDLFYILSAYSSMAVMCLLMNEKTRKYYLPINSTDENGTVSRDIDLAVKIENDKVHGVVYKAVQEAVYETVNEEVKNRYFPISSFFFILAKKGIYEIICEIISSPQFKEDLGDNLHVFSAVPDGCWQHVETKKKKFMIISMHKCDFVRNSGKTGEELDDEKINNKFVIVDGIDYKSNLSGRELLYMEV